MKQVDEILSKLHKATGLTLERVDAANVVGDVYVDENDGTTTFKVEYGSKIYAFRFDGAGKESEIVAALSREFILSALIKYSSVDEPVRAFLDGTGEIPPGVHVGKSDFYVFAVFGGGKHKEVGEYIAAMTMPNDFCADMGDNVTAFCKKADSDSDYRSAGEFALVLKENLSEEFEGGNNIKIGVGGIAHGVSELPLYYSYARSALVGGAEFDPNNDIYSYKEYALVKILSDLSPVVAEKYVKTVLDKNFKTITDDEELMTAADAFFKCSLNISEASRFMYVHRNTLIYRLDKIEKLTGLNIRNFNDAMTFRVACLISKML
ncbi:MAG: helix-turn-helix domain-containing protein [Clostridiales bacterium]|nr:helix-turn-helix domain-containing protein [Clostridiales bacterium]